MDIPNTAVELPCGWLEKGKFDTTAQIVPMTGLVRKLLARPDVRKNASRVIDTLLLNCVQSVGPVTRMNAGNVGQLFLADRDFLTLSIRRASLGQYVNSVVVCGQCEEKIDLKFDLNEAKVLKLKDLKYRMVGATDEVAVPAFDLEDAELGVKATFRYPIGKDQEAVVNILKKNPVEANYKLYLRCLLEWNGEPAERISPTLFDEQSLPVLNFIDKEFMAAQPGPDIRQMATCPLCGADIRMEMETSDFLFPLPARERT
jgi:hypothetical protein